MKSEMFFIQKGMTKNLRRNSVFFNHGIIGQKLQQKVASPIREKKPNDCLLVQTLHSTRRRKNKNMFCSSARTSLTVYILGACRDSFKAFVSDCSRSGLAKKMV
jgi:hypothetical protein